jgi:hypothetical protein
MWITEPYRTVKGPHPKGGKVWRKAEGQEDRRAEGQKDRRAVGLKSRRTEGLKSSRPGDQKYEISFRPDRSHSLVFMGPFGLLLFCPSGLLAIDCAIVRRAARPSAPAQDFRENPKSSPLTPQTIRLTLNQDNLSWAEEDS